MVLAGLLAALFLLVIPVPAATAATTAVPSGTVAGKITGAVGDTHFHLRFLPITGAGEGLVRAVTTDGSGNFGGVSVPSGGYHVLVTSDNGASTAGWFPGNTLFERDAARLTVSTGATVPVTWTLGTNPSTMTSSTSSTASGASVEIAAYNYNFEGFERYPYASVVVPAGTSFSLKGLPAGYYVITATDLSQYPQKYTTTQDYGVSLAAGVTQSIPNFAMAPLSGGFPSVERLAGPDRYSTAVAIANAAVSSPPSVVIANGESFPDALSAAPAGGLHAMPMLLVKPGSIPQVVKDQLASWMPAHIYVIGGTGTISAGVATQLGAYGTVTRIWGADRYATSRAVADFFWPSADYYSMYLANGTAFPDALAAGPAAAYYGGPVVLTKGSAPHLEAATATLIDDQGADFPVRIAGGTGAVSSGIEADLAGLVRAHPRISGVDRYATAAQLADSAFGSSTIVYLATGADFPDALAGAAAATINSAPVLLVKKTCIPIAAYAQLERLRPNRVILLGGTGVLSDALLTLPVCAGPS